MDDKKKIIERIKKLFQLADVSKNSNIEEATSAAAKAQKLMEKHRIKKAMLNKIGPIQKKDLIDKGTPNNWKLYLMSGIAKQNGSYIIQSETYAKDNCVCIVGEQQDIDMVQQIYTYLVNELNKFCIAELLIFKKAVGFYPNTDFANSFYLGAVTKINQRLKEAKEYVRKEELKKATTQDQIVLINNALAVIDDKIEKVKDWIKNNCDAEFKSVPLNTSDAKGYVAGQLAGEKINLNPNMLDGE